MRSAVSLLVAAALAVAAAAPARAQGETVVERYSVAIGTSSAGAAAKLTDRRFGDGTARARVAVAGGSDATTLSARVWRNVEPGEVVFALLVFKVEVRAYDAGGEVVFSEDLEGFTFGDSAAGDWKKGLTLPAEAVRVDLTFYGNYE
jgi:hypothetical protein